MGQRGTVLNISGLHSGYGVIKAIKDMNIHMDRGGLASLLGANGVSESTLLKSVIGMVHIGRGSIKYQRGGPVGKKSHEIIPMGVSIVPGGRKMSTDATVMEDLAIGSYTGAADKALDQRVLGQIFKFFPRLAEGETQMGGTLSGGEQQMLAIRRAAMSGPKLLLLNGPFMGLTPLMVEQVFHIIEKLKRVGITTLLMEQNARMVIKVSDRSYMLNTRKIVGELDASDGVSQDALPEVYLGKNGKQRGKQVS